MERTELRTPRTRLSDGIRAALGESIVSGRLPPGTRLRDVEIASRFRVSRMPVREALLRLEVEGLVTIDASRSTVVTPASSTALADALDVLVGQAGAVGALTLARGIALETAARRATAGLSKTDTAAAAIAWDVVRELASASGNALAADALAQVDLRLQRALRPLAHAGERALGALRELDAAARAGDGRGADDALRGFVDAAVAEALAGHPRMAMPA
ncbi:GntR family transcriptional regulator [Microbacterium gilvum]|uniref:HTH gntR-type domain-containing protein n=1 Tax=Microbacterium gilvum TaxID=1336204 RepID=A0ABP9A1H2_9MICO